LTRLDPPWEAQLTYTFRLEPDQDTKCKEDLAKISVGDFPEYRRVVEFYLDKYVGKTYGGAIENQMEAERDSLEKITLQSLGRTPGRREDYSRGPTHSSNDS